MKVTEFSRCMIVLAGVAAFALCASAAGAQTVSAADREALAGPWVGRWDSDTHEYGATMSLTVGADGSVEGKIDWTLRSSNRPDYKSKVGLKGVEYVRGTFLSSASVLSIDGYRLDDPNKVLGTDKYRLILSENRRTIGGITWDHGTWGGRIFLKR